MRAARLLAGVGIIASLAYLGWFVAQGFRPGSYHYQRGAAYVEAEKPKEAVEEWLQGAAKDPTDPRCPQMLGDYFHGTGRFPDAVRFYGQAAKYEKQDGQLYLRYSQSLHHVGDREGALTAAERAARLLPTSAEAQGHYGLQLAAAKKRPEAVRALRKAHELEPENRLYTLGLVEVLMDTLQMAEAERLLEQYLKKHPEDHQACFKMAVVYNQKPRTPENLATATRYAEKALPGMHRQAQGYSVLGQLYLDAGRVKDALQLYTIGRQFAPNAESILRGLADCYTRLGRTRELEAISAEFRKVLARHDRIDHLKHVMGFNNQDITSGLELARLTEEEGLLQEARQYYEQLVRQAPNDGRTRRALAGFYRRIREPELAKRALSPGFTP